MLNISHFNSRVKSQVVPIGMFVFLFNCSGTSMDVYVLYRFIMVLIPIS